MQRSSKPTFAEAFASSRGSRNTLADLCVENFYEMRDRVGSRWFLLRKKLAIVLHKLFPGWYLPLYTMIEFTRIPYSAALRRARRQDRIVAAVGIGLMLLVFFFCIAACGFTR